MRQRIFAMALALPLLIIGCAAPETVEGEDEGATESAISGKVAAGEQFVTTARLNLREGPSTSEDIKITLPLNSTVTVKTGKPRNGFYEVDTDEGEGWVYGQYLKTSASKVKSAPAADDADDEDDGADQTGTGTGQIETCKASFYGQELAGNATANGESFNPNAMTAAHKKLPFNTKVRVTNTANGKTVVVRINDRGPFVTGRCIDLATAAFAKIAPTSQGIASVKVEVLE